MAWWAKGDFTKLDKSSITSGGDDPDLSRVVRVENAIKDEQSGIFGILGLGANTGIFLATAGLFPEVGMGPRGSMLKFWTLPQVPKAVEEDWVITSGVVRDAAKGKGNFGLGSATYDEAIDAGKAWVGDGYTVSKSGNSWISAHGLRQFRPPSFKPKLGKQQANFEWRNVNSGSWQGNGHVDIIKP